VNVDAIGKRIVIWGVAAAVLVGLLVYALLPRPVQVDAVTVTPGPFRATLDAEGRTQIRDVFTISAPVGGRMLRNPLEVGDVLIAGETVVATIEPSDPALLDPRAFAESRHELEAAEAERTLAAAELARAEADLEFATSEVDRARELFARGTVPRRFVEEAERAFRSAEAGLGAARAGLAAREHQVLRARARLIVPADVRAADGTCDCVSLTAPVNGRVLRMFEKSETVVTPGAPLLEVGDPELLEVVADFLSADAVRIEPGHRAVISGWGGEGMLDARVRRVEPFGFTKISALGIEEQRVNVILDLTSPSERWASLGHGYRVVVHVVVWEDDAALTVPVTALFRREGDWRVFRVEEGRARERIVVTGHRSGLRVAVEEGLTGGDTILSNPPEAVSDGVRLNVVSHGTPHHGKP
jgi:HlyD family secretion protein